MTVRLIVHGGAGLLKTDDHDSALAGCRSAVAAGREPLLNGGSAVDAVEAAVRAMEADQQFNAGYGSVLNRNGVVEMDAMVLDGSGMRAGAVAAVQRIQHPVSLARLIMERTKHHLLAAAGAEQFGAENGMPLVDIDSMIAPRRRAEFDAAQNPSGSADTVGAVAVDDQGHVAVAVSTGGIRGKQPGRVGDSPIIGAGGYAEDGVGAACATGVGEGIMRSLLTFRAVQFLAQGLDAQAAAEQAIAVFGSRFGGDGGLILVDRHGKVGIAHNSPYMPVAWTDGDEIRAQAAQRGE